MIDDRDTDASRDNHSISWNTRRNHATWKLYLRDADGKPTPYAITARQTNYCILSPACTFIGNREPFYCETLAFVGQLEAAGVPAHADVYPTDFHAFGMLLPFRKISRQAIAAFETQYLYATEHYSAPQPPQQLFRNEGTV